MGLNAVLKEKVEFANGGVKSANFSDCHTLRMSKAPHIEVYLLESDAKIGGLGEPPCLGLLPQSPTHSLRARGARIRRFPLTPERVLEALSRI